MIRALISHNFFQHLADRFPSKLIYSFAFLSDTLLLVASGRSYNEPEDGGNMGTDAEYLGPSLEVYQIPACSYLSTGAVIASSSSSSTEPTASGESEHVAVHSKVENGAKELYKTNPKERPKIICSFHLPKFAYDKMSDEIVVLREMVIRSDPSPSSSGMASPPSPSCSADV
jgi:hypothetical protein